LRHTTGKAIAQRAQRMGLDLDELGSTRFRDLSGGTKQKFMAALALAAEAPVLVCDEPTANLDSESRAAFFAELDARPKHAITLLCSHRLDEVRQLVDRVVELGEGRVVRDASVDELMADERRFRIEVVLDASASPAVHKVLEESGFSRLGPGRYETLVSQAQKVALTARLLREHGSAISDLSVYHVESVVLPAAPPKLEVVR
jgi:ABC-2 type transport system ATP-binding protein